MQRNIVSDLGFRERIEHHFLAQTLQAQFVAQRAERMIERYHLGEAQARQPHKPRAATSPRHIVDELDRRPIAPVQVFGHQQQRALLCVAVQQFTHFPQHAVRTDAGKLAPQCVSLLRSAQPRQLQQPGRRHGAQQRRQGGVAAAQIGQRLQHRQVRLAGAVVFHAMAACAGDAAKAGEEILDQRGLANPRFSGEPDYCTLAAVSPLPRPLQL
ncbi:hypothetical protein PS691_04182 [Pseudomonas fluorescens]|uniref:Uncharacterized protein n=1 Tax=Pseudomonas fluorescens TaxID=294 RepID=A0A5E7DTP7_PSEFL|nr:hypothetical protein PS691_04182 [Pseudomonas fluorescens]